MSRHIDDEPVTEQDERAPERVEQGNPGRPQSDFENPRAGAVGRTAGRRRPPALNRVSRPRVRWPRARSWR